MPTPNSPLPPMIERSMRAQSLLPAGQSGPPLVKFFHNALLSFQDSAAAFCVVGTLPPLAYLKNPGNGHPLYKHQNHLPRPVRPPTTPHTLVVLDSSFNPPTRAHLRMVTSGIYDLVRGEGQKLSALRVLLLLAVNNADKAPKPAAFEQRLAMMWAFAKDVQDEVRAGQREEPSQGEAASSDEELSIDIGLSTLPYFAEKSAEIAASDFYTSEAREGARQMEQVILAGYDTLIRIFNPKYYAGPPTSEGEVTSAGQTPMQRALGPFFDRVKLRVTLRTNDEWGGKEEQRAYLEDLLQADGLTRIGGDKEWAGRIELTEGRKEAEQIVSSTYAREAAQKQDWDKLDEMATPAVREWIQKQKLYSEQATQS
ncbi:hypothetical protein B0H67DRAFT_554848 [Lasiosphaeris hirsuta]|uniref:Nicotinamide-nucleotide adenylyltransferase n=1 Tax=Lasiosphaeris hirsuta TaxID=260670 RepID=A0AA40A7K4_9PEZI|nr:hypothetical protein B0H67DRAFT_554848 [Lasiosphaeris hirsuta]